MKLEKIKTLLLEHSIKYVVAVPCSELSKALEVVSQTEEIKTILPQREDEAVAIMAGLVAGGERCLGMFQDAIFGNSSIVLSFFTQFEAIQLNLWIGFRSGDYLKANTAHMRLDQIAHKIIPELDYKVNTMSCKLRQEEFTEEDEQKMRTSLTTGNRILIWNTGF